MFVIVLPVHSDPDILGGTPVFVGTRVPVRNLLDYLEAGDSLGEFLQDFPGVTRDQAVAGAEYAKRHWWPMCVLLDECLPRRLRSHLAGHDVQTVQAMGWSGKKNGELLRVVAAQGFEVLITADQNMQYQQNLEGGGRAIVVLVAEATGFKTCCRLFHRS